MDSLIYIIRSIHKVLLTDNLSNTYISSSTLGKMALIVEPTVSHVIGEIFQFRPVRGVDSRVLLGKRNFARRLSRCNVCNAFTNRNLHSLNYLYIHTVLIVLIILLGLLSVFVCVCD